MIKYIYRLYKEFEFVNGRSCNKVLDINNLNKDNPYYYDLLELQENAIEDCFFTSIEAKARQKIYDDYSSIIYYSLFHQNEVIKEIIEILTNISPNSCLVGGAVRDMIYSEIPKDFDFATDTPYHILKNYFVKYGFTVTETGKQFLVLNVSKNGTTCEVANFRSDSKESDGRRPANVKIGTIEEDAERRDFTINSLMFNLKRNFIIDCNESIQDIIDKKLKFVGNPKERIKEDYLRVMRFYRFIGKGFIPDTKSLKSVRELFEESIKNTSTERIRTELEKIVKL